MTAKIAALLVALALIAAPCSEVRADFGGKFPGKGDNLTWQKANILFDEGNVFFNSNRLDQAIAKYKEAIAVYPHDSEYHNYLGLSYKKKGEMKLAEESLRQAIALNGCVWSSWSNLGSVLKHQHKLAEAKDAYSKSLQFNPPAKNKVLIQQNVTALEREIHATGGSASAGSAITAEPPNAAASGPAPPASTAASTATSAGASPAGASLVTPVPRPASPSLPQVPELLPLPTSK
jgi:tetratricopeptide (TPR) repeat protein